MFFYVFIIMFLCFLCGLLRFFSVGALKSVWYLCLCVLLASSLFVLGLRGLYVYIILLIFFSGLLSLIVYLRSLEIGSGKSNIIFIIVFRRFISFYLIIFFYFDLFYGLVNSDFVYRDLSLFFLFWLVFVLIILLIFLRYNFFFKYCLRSV